MPGLAALTGRERAAGATDRMMPADRAARVILDGVERNRALIVFPANVRWGRRLCAVLPGNWSGRCSAAGTGGAATGRRPSGPELSELAGCVRLEPDKASMGS
jgi:hypothetical protein